MTAYAPIGGSRPATPKSPKVLDDAIITMIAADHEYTPAQVALAWGVMRGYSVIPKSVNPQRLRANLAAADIILTVEEMSQIAAAETGVRSVTGDIFTMEGSPYTQENLWDEEPK